MFATVMIGDLVLAIVEQRIDQMDTTHTVICTDQLDNKSSTTKLDNEVQACQLLSDFLQLDGPGESFVAHFPEHC